MVLEDVKGFEWIADWASFHHEKLSGAGYPFHLAADGLDMGARIMAVADIFSAINEAGPYRDGMDRTRAMAVLDGGSSGVGWTLPSLMCSGTTTIRSTRCASGSRGLWEAATIATSNSCGRDRRLMNPADTCLPV